MATAFIFPGQGSQEVGMGKALADAYPVARAIFEEVDEALGERLSDTIWNGPAEALTLTANAQPALMAVSLAALRAIEAEVGRQVWNEVHFVAGHSLGEYSALAAAGTFSVADAARLLRLRGKAMQEAVPVGEGAMAALLGLDYGAVREVVGEAAAADCCDAANDNAPGQVVVSGSRAAVERAIGLAKARGAKRAILLPVSAPFHSGLMRPVGPIMAEALAAVPMRAPRVPLVANVLARPIDDPEEIRRRLVEQVSGAVRWRESVEFMAGAGVGRFVEIGAGKVLSGLVKRMAPEAELFSVGTPDQVAAFATRG
jgi:[acyl-carrier-protein] S-malonyltransferase